MFISTEMLETPYVVSYGSGAQSATINLAGYFQIRFPERRITVALAKTNRKGETFFKT